MRCFFHLVSAFETLLDDVGVEVPNVQVAKVEALKVIGDLRQASDEQTEDWVGWRLDIMCPKGSLLHSIPLSPTHN